MATLMEFRWKLERKAVYDYEVTILVSLHFYAFFSQSAGESSVSSGSLGEEERSLSPIVNSSSSVFGDHGGVMPPPPPSTMAAAPPPASGKKKRKAPPPPSTMKG